MKLTYIIVTLTLTCAQHYYAYGINMYEVIVPEIDIRDYKQIT